MSEMIQSLQHDEREELKKFVQGNPSDKFKQMVRSNVDLAYLVASFNLNPDTQKKLRQKFTTDIR